MSDTQYAYAVARIRSKELSLLNVQAIEQLLASKSYEECLHLLEEKGWGISGNNVSAELLLSAEQEKTWDLIRELVPDMSVFDVFLYAKDFHNLKAAIKLVYSGKEHDNIFFTNGTIDFQLILEAVRANDFSLLPEKMRNPAKEAFETLLHTHDGQLCDIILDQAALESIYAAGKKSKNELIQLYAELTVASVNIKIAVRAQKTKKSLDLIQRSMTPCDTLNVQTLSHAAAHSLEAIYEYLANTDYVDAVHALKESPSAFERWCDNLIIRKIRPQQYNPFTIGPIAAYILARENEIKTVRIILSGKLNHFKDEIIRERLREMYV